MGGPVSTFETRCVANSTWLRRTMVVLAVFAGAGCDDPDDSRLSDNEQTSTLVAALQETQPPEDSGEPAATFTECSVDGGFFKIARANAPIAINDDFDLLTECAAREHVGVACGQLKSLPNTHVCLFSTQRDMNLSLYRASHALEIEPVVLTDNELREHEGYDGHDLTGESLEAFLQSFAKAKTRHGKSTSQTDDDTLGDVPEEAEFWELFLEPEIEPGMILIAGFLRDDVDIIVSHELYHAQFFTDINYQKAVIDFWDDELPKLNMGPGRDLIEATITQEYDVARNPLLLYNEFQAYALQLPLRSGELDLVEIMQPYKQPLRDHLIARGVPPLEFAPPPGDWATMTE